jgi:hypothetical protein
VPRYSAAVRHPESPWPPRATPAMRRLINDIVLVGASDQIDGEFNSHVELYLRAMTRPGADTGPNKSFLGGVEAGEPVPDALRATATPAPATLVELCADDDKRRRERADAAERALTARQGSQLQEQVAQG